MLFILDGDVRRHPPYMVSLSYLIGFARACSHVTNFNGTNLADQVPPSVTQYVVLLSPCLCFFIVLIIKYVI